MPGLPKVPSAEKIDLTDDGKVVGLFCARAVSRGLPGGEESR